MFFNLFFILPLVLRILHVLFQILTQSTPNSQQIKPINLVNKPTQIKPRSRNRSQQTQKNTIKPRPTQSNPDPTTIDQHNQTTITPLTKPKIHPTDQSPNPLINQQTHSNKVTKPTTTIIDQKRERKRDFTIINGPGGGRDRAPFWPRRRLRSSSILSKPPLALFLDLLQTAETKTEIELHSLKTTAGPLLGSAPNRRDRG